MSQIWDYDPKINNSKWKTEFNITNVNIMNNQASKTKQTSKNKSKKTSYINTRWERDGLAAADVRALEVLITYKFVMSKWWTKAAKNVNMNVSHFNRLRRSKTKEGPVLLGPAVFIVLSAVLCAGNHILKVTMIKRTLIKIAKCVERRILERRRVGTESYFQIYEGPLLGFLLVPECTLL